MKEKYKLYLSFFINLSKYVRNYLCFFQIKDKRQLCEIKGDNVPVKCGRAVLLQSIPSKVCVVHMM